MKILLAATVMLAGMYISNIAAARKADDLAWQTWALNCQGCHRSDAKGTPGGAPPMAGVVAKFLQVPGGREYLVKVPGVSTAPVEDEELARLLNWMLLRFDPSDLPEDFKRYTAEEVRGLRRVPLRTDAATVRASLLAGRPAVR